MGLARFSGKWMVMLLFLPAAEPSIPGENCQAGMNLAFPDAPFAL
jgi:hypothetical protein